MPFKSIKYKDEHEISRILHERGFNRNRIREWFSTREDGRPISYDTISRWMCNPGKYLSLDQIELIASKLDLPFLYVLGLIRGMNRSGARKWYEANKEAFK